MEQETEEIVNEEPEPVKSAKKTKIKPHRLSTSNSTPPSKQKKCRKSLPTKKEHTIPETSDLQQILTTINALSKRIDKLETVTVKLGKNLANTVLDIKTMNNVVCELRNELTKSVDSTLKHELSVVREEQHDLKDEMEKKLKKAEVEVKRLKGRVASLVDEKNNLIKQMKSLQNDNKSLKQNTTNKTPKVKENRLLSLPTHQQIKHLMLTTILLLYVKHSTSLRLQFLILQLPKLLSLLLTRPPKSLLSKPLMFTMTKVPPSLVNTILSCYVTQTGSF